MNIIGDIAGKNKTLEALIKKMPQGQVLSVGDMCDRGLGSKQVLEYFFKHGKSLLGNHEHLLIDAWTFSKSLSDKNSYKPFYAPTVWLENGGYETLRSFRPSLPEVRYWEPYRESFPDIAVRGVHTIIPEEIILWLKGLPLFLEYDKFLITHGPIHCRNSNLEELGTGFFGGTDYKSEYSVIWNRQDPRPIEGKIQIFGHNNKKGILYYTKEFPKGTFTVQPKENIFAMCIDAGKSGSLWGIHLPTMEVFSQENID